MRARSLSLASLLLLAPLAQSCATIVKGSTQAVLFNSTPQGAELTYGNKTFTTPCLVSLSRQYAPLYLPIYLKGYAPQTLTVKSHFNGWIIGNLVFGGITGILIDAVTGAGNSFDMENYTAILLPTSEDLVAEHEAAREKRRALATAEEKKPPDSPFGRPKS
jgi:hypothetical protein